MVERGATGDEVSSVYTGRMSLREAQHALGVLEATHTIPLLMAHSHHQPIKPADILLAPEGAYIRGTVVKDLAACPKCFVALTAARTDNTRYELSVLVPEEFVEEEPDEPGANPVSAQPE